jgi:hypothetical protein
VTAPLIVGLAEIGSKGAKLESSLENLKQKKDAANDKQRLDLYLKTCEMRRATRLARLIETGQSLKGVPRGTVKKLRVVEIQYRAAGVGSNRNGGPAGRALASTPVSIDNGTWDVKVVLGDARVYEDGSVCFNVPARIPVYFQAIDGKGLVVQSMRSWSTLQPGETLSCIGCHEDKNEAPVVTAKPTIAMRLGPQKLKPFYGPPQRIQLQQRNPTNSRPPLHSMPQRPHPKTR